MKMMLWRVLSLWLCVAVVCWCPSYVGCTKSQEETRGPVSSQDVSTEEELGENSQHHKVKESFALPVESFSENKKTIKYGQKEEEATQEVENKHYSEASGVKESAVKEELEVKEISQTEPEPQENSQNQQPEPAITQNQEPVFLPPSSDPVSGPAELKDNPNTLKLQDNTLNSISDDASDSAAPEVTDSQLPLADCAEEENNPYNNESNPPLVLDNVSNPHTTGTQTLTDPPLSPPAAPSSQLETNTSHKLKEDPASPVTSVTDTIVNAKDPEPIPTFDEWKRKEMEVEKEKTQSTHTSNNGATQSPKKPQKNFNNYASVECGAKILGANPEAKSTSAILEENMDLYMLNPCSNKIWFIIELCEPIQVKQLDIANFELFSSTPKDFLVSISDRYPTNKWLKLGTFHARDERTIQSFPLDEHLYAKYVKMFTKYIKVELLSHFGSEHFCPLSLLRVFGTSMVEEYEEIADPSERPDDQDDDLDYPPRFAPGEDKLSKNLIGSATDVILNMVNNIAVNVLGGGEQGNLSIQDVNRTELFPQPEVTTPTTTTDFTLVPEPEEKEIFPEPNIPETEAPASEGTVIDTPAEGASEQGLPLVEGESVVTSEKDEEEHISSTIILLGKDDDSDEEQQNRDQQEQHHDTQNCFSLLSSCSCAASLQEYLHQQCAALLSKKRKCQTMNKKQTIPTIQTPAWPFPLSPSACPEPQQHHSEVHQPNVNEQAPGKQPDSRASSSETPQPPGSTTESHKDSMSEPPPLEPSQTSNLPGPSATDTSSAKPTPIVETPQLSSEDPVREPRPEKSQDVPAAQKHIELSASLTPSLSVMPTATATVDHSSVAPTEVKTNVDISQLEINKPVQIPDRPDESQVLHPTTSPELEHQPDPPEGGTASTDPPHPAPDIDVTEPVPSADQAVITEAKTDDFVEDIPTMSVSNGQLPRPSPPAPSPSPSSTSASLSDIYADPTNGTEQNGNQVHGTNQKESVFMRLNNRIKALEMNMSLSGRYLEQLSQRYRKQMEEMQKAFNKTIIKLQNTSRIAEEQDQRQTESIQSLQGQLENVTQLVLNLSVRVSQLQSEVSDRENYLLLSLVLCLFLGLMCANHCRMSTVNTTTEPEPPLPKSYTYCCPERQFSSSDEKGLKRSASYPLIHSESFQLANAEDPELVQAGETQSLCPANRKRRRRKIKPLEKVETLKPSFHAPPELCNDSLSEGSSEASSHSDDPSFCGITTACSRMCDSLPPPKTRAEKRALRRRRPKSSCAVVDLLQIPRRDKNEPLAIATIEDIMKKTTEQSSGTYGVNVALSGPV